MGNLKKVIDNFSTVIILKHKVDDDSRMIRISIPFYNLFELLLLLTQIGFSINS